MVVQFISIIYDFQSSAQRPRLAWSHCDSCQNCASISGHPATGRKHFQKIDEGACLYIFTKLRTYFLGFFYYYGSKGALIPHLRECLQTPGVCLHRLFYISSLYWCMAIKPFYFIRQNSLSALTTALGTRPQIRRFAHPALATPLPAQPPP